MRTPFPFSAIVGQDDLKRALMIAVVDPAIGGVMAFGDRGSGKSTAIRALAALLPPLQVVKGCAYACDPARDAAECASDCAARRTKGAVKTETAPTPVVDLPLGATEDRVLGALDLERALTRGEKRFEPGLLARAHRGFLYVDEINLLEDHLVDLLLDVAASGENIVEREGLSIRHPARFVLIGSGNPEEGELRPQLLDRFGLAVDVRTPADVAARIAIVRAREAYDRDADAFAAAHADAERALRAALAQARARRNAVSIADPLLAKIAAICVQAGVEGLRGELTMMRAACALAALDGRDAAREDDVRAVAAMALRHRLRRDPLDDIGSTARIDRVVAEVLGA
ncbi:MAG: magnesium chelatase ATPase subunit I [Hyphomonadaceae bacterium]|nr:magnesium chelatase ATPase subunit I [Hyphomonadaceae bacterium]